MNTEIYLEKELEPKLVYNVNNSDNTWDLVDRGTERYLNGVSDTICALDVSLGTKQRLLVDISTYIYNKIQISNAYFNCPYFNKFEPLYNNNFDVSPSICDDSQAQPCTPQLETTVDLSYVPQPDYLDDAYRLRIDELCATGMSPDDAVRYLDSIVVDSRRYLRLRRRRGFLINKRNAAINKVRFSRALHRYKVFPHGSEILDAIDNCTPIAVFLYHVFRSRNMADVVVAVAGLQHSLRKQFPQFEDFVKSYFETESTFTVWADIVRGGVPPDDDRRYESSTEDWFKYVVSLAKNTIPALAYLLFSLFGLYSALTSRTFPHVLDLSKSAYSSAMEVSNTIKSYTTTIDCVKSVFNSLSNFVSSVFVGNAVDVFANNPFGHAIDLGTRILTSQSASMITSPGELAIAGKLCSDYCKAYEVCKFNKDQRDPFKTTWGSSWSDVERQHVKVMSYVNDYTKLMRSSSVRRAPFTFMLYGGTSLGKSTLMTTILNCLSKWGNLPEDDKFWWYYSPGAKHMDGYMPWKTAVVIDDAGAVRSNYMKEGDPQVINILRFANNVPYLTPQADLPDKKCTPFMSQILAISSNISDLGAKEYMKQAAVLERRIKYRIRVCVDPTVANENNLLSQDVATKLISENPGGVPMLWRLSVDEYVAKNDTNEGIVTITGSWVPIQGCNNLDLREFLRWLRRQYKLHMDSQESIVSFATGKFDYCQACLLPINLCDCNDVDDHVVSNNCAQPKDSTLINCVKTCIKSLYVKPSGVESKLPGWSDDDMPEAYEDVDSDDDGSVEINHEITRVRPESDISFKSVMFGCCATYFVLKVAPKFGLIGSVGDKIVSFGFNNVVRAAWRKCLYESDLMCRKSWDYCYNKLPNVIVNVCNDVSAAAADAFRVVIRNRLNCIIAFLGSCVGIFAAYVMMRPSSDKGNFDEFHHSCSGCDHPNCPKRLDPLEPHGNFVTNARVPLQPVNWDDSIQRNVYNATNTFLSHPSRCANGSSTEPALQRIRESLAVAHVTQGCRHSYFKATILGGGFVLVNAHSLSSFFANDFQLTLILSDCGCSVKVFGHKKSARGWTGFVKPSNVYVPKSDTGVPFDIALVYISSLNMNGCEQYIALDQSFSVHTDPSLLSRGDDGIIGNRNALVDCVRVHKISTEFPCEGGKEMRYFDDAIKYRPAIATQRGDSGSIILLHTGDYAKGIHGNLVICGIHVGSISENQCIGALFNMNQLSQWKAALMSSTIKPESDFYVKSYSSASRIKYAEEPFGLKEPLTNTHFKSCVSRTSVSVGDSIEHVEVLIPQLVTVFGGLRHGTFDQGVKSRFVKTIWSDYLEKMRCSALGNLTNLYCPAVVPRNRLWEVHTRAYNASVADSTIGVPETICDIAGAQYLKEFIHQVDIKGGKWSMVRPFSTYDAINGVPGLFKKMNFSTGSGFSYNGSKNCFLVDDDVVCVNGVPLHVNPKKLRPDAQADLDRMETMLGQGVDPCSVFEAHIKDEIRTKVKVDASKLRVMNGSQLPYTIVMRKYLMGVVLIMAFNKYASECMVGMNVESFQWTHFATWLQDYGGLDRFLDGDYVDFDKNQKSVISGAASRVIIGMILRASESTIWTEKDILCASTLIISLQSCCVNFFGTLVKFMGINPSGHSLTTQKNCIVNSIYMRAVFYVLAAEHNPKVLSDPFWYIGNVRQGNYGDDVVMAVKNTCPWFNHGTIQHTLATWGCPYTRADKSDITDANIYTNFDDLTFLKRKWVMCDEISMYLAEIDINTIVKMLHYYERSSCLSVQQQHVQLLRAANELAFTLGRVRHEQVAILLRDLAMSYSSPIVNGLTVCANQYINGISDEGCSVNRLPSFDDYLARITNNSVINVMDDDIEFEILDCEVSPQSCVASDGFVYFGGVGIESSYVILYGGVNFTYNINIDSTLMGDMSIYYRIYELVQAFNYEYEWFRSNHWCEEFSVWYIVNRYNHDDFLNSVDDYMALML